MGGLTALAVVVVAYTLVASKLDRWWITGPMVFVAAGAILGPGGLDVLPFALGNETVLTITELTLALLLFSDASTVRLERCRGRLQVCPAGCCSSGCRSRSLPARCWPTSCFPEIGWAAAALVATILAPTDAALGLAVVTNKSVPVRIRRALNVESGLNDGIATPFVTLFIAVVAAEEALGDTAWGLEALKQIGLAIVAAVVVGYLGGWLLAFADQRGWTSGVSEQIAILALALLAYRGPSRSAGTASSQRSPVASCSAPSTRAPAGRSRSSSPRHSDCRPHSWSGRSSVRSSWDSCSARTLGSSPIVYAVLSLTVIRMVPVAIALAGTHLRPATVAFMGWFGPRGLASVVFTLLALEEIEHGSDGGRCSCRPSPGPSCSRWSCTASRRPRWPPGTARRSRRPATSRRRRRPVSRRSGFATLPAATATDSSRCDETT